MSTPLYFSVRLKKAAITAACALMTLAAASGNVVAAPEEIQVYMDEFEEAGKFGLDLHTNYVAAGQPPSEHQSRVTPELSYGLNTSWELGGYWLTVKDMGGSPQTDGVKIRAKYRHGLPFVDSPFYWAVNFELGQLARRDFQDETSGEVKLIGVWKTDPWTLGINLNADRALRTHPAQAASTEIDAKAAYTIRDGFQVGAEGYYFLGANHFDPAQPTGSNANYLVSDFSIGKWDLNVGIGHVTGQSSDKTVMKAIIGVPLD